MSDLTIHEPSTGDAIVWLVWDDGDYYGPNLVTVQPTKDAAVSWLDAHLATSEYYKPGQYSQFYVEGLAAGAVPTGASSLLHESVAPDDPVMAMWFADRAKV